MRGELSKALLYTGGTFSVGAAVVLIGVAGLGMVALPALVAGAVAAVTIQLMIYWVLFFWVFSDRPGLAYGLGAVVRLLAVVIMALGGVKLMGLTPAPTLLSMVACLFGSTLLEALIIQRRGMARVGPGVATMR